MLPPVNPAGHSPGAAPDPGAPHPAEAFIPDLSEGAETGVYLALLLLAVLLGLWSAFPEADPRIAAPLAHFYIVSFTTFAATVTGMPCPLACPSGSLRMHP